jgi:hypothetical protein
MSAVPIEVVSPEDEAFDSAGPIPVPTGVPARATDRMPDVASTGRHGALANAARRADERIARLNRLSVGRGKDAFTDVAWDDPDMAVGPDDARLRVLSFDPLSDSEWYRSLTPADQARAGAWKFASSLKTGWHFENLMCQSFLHRMLYSDGAGPEYRYHYHEVIEECQHTLMFNELIQRLGVPAKGAPWWLRRVGEICTPVMAKHFPAAFFVLVLCGEEPVDRYQRQALAEGIEHPLVQAIMRIHVAEEARHVSFARASLERDTATMGWLGRQVLGLHAAVSFAFMTRVMLQPPREMAKDLGVSHATLRDAYRNDAGRAFLIDAVAGPQRLLADLGLLTGPAARVWRALGLGPA